MKGTAVSIGVSRESVVEARKAIMEIIKSNNGDSVKIASLSCLSTLCNVNGTTVSNCTFNGI